MQLGLAQAKARLSELSALVDAGQEVIIAKHGRPSYRLVALAPSTPVPTPASTLASVSEAAPNGLGDMLAFIAQVRSQTRKLGKGKKAVTTNFVATMRHSERY